MASFSHSHHVRAFQRTLVAFLLLGTACQLVAGADGPSAAATSAAPSDYDYDTVDSLAAGELPAGSPRSEQTSPSGAASLAEETDDLLGEIKIFGAAPEWDVEEGAAQEADFENIRIGRRLQANAIAATDPVTLSDQTPQTRALAHLDRAVLDVTGSHETAPVSRCRTGPLKTAGDILVQAQAQIKLGNMEAARKLSLDASRQIETCQMEVQSKKIVRAFDAQLGAALRAGAERIDLALADLDELSSRAEDREDDRSPEETSAEAAVPPVQPKPVANPKQSETESEESEGADSFGRAVRAMASGGKGARRQKGPRRAGGMPGGDGQKAAAAAAAGNVKLGGGVSRDSLNQPTEPASVNASMEDFRR